MSQDRLLEPLQGLAGLDPELVDENMPRALIGSECVGLSIGAVEREQLLRARPLVQRMLADDQLQLAEHVLVAAEREIAIDPIHQGCEAQLVEPRDLVAPLRLERQTGQRRATPQCERVPKELSCGIRLTRCGTLVGVGGQPLRTQRVEALGLEREPVTTGHGGDRIPAVAPERLAQLGQVDADGLPRRRRRRRAPQVVDQPLGRDHLVRTQEQNRQDRSLFQRPERNRRPAVKHFERPEDPEFHPQVLPPGEPR